MSEYSKISTPASGGRERRCLQCDSVIPAGSQVCLMCGAELETASPEFEDASRAEQDAIEERVAETSAVSGGEELPLPEARKAAVVDGGVMESVWEERQSRIVFWMTNAAFLITGILVR